MFKVTKCKRGLYVSDTVDIILGDDDVDDDGYLTYAEYRMSRAQEELEKATDIQQT